MQVLETIAAVRSALAEARSAGKTIGFVPTMGALHIGHLSLFKRAQSENDVVIGSIFVNPTQFNNADDLQKYPRNVQQDVQLLAAQGVDFVFTPAVSEMYDARELAQPFSFDFNGLDAVMEGAMRPGHFNGVVQVVSKLFHIIEPTRAYFGEKDFQQLAIIRYMVERSALRETFHDLAIVGCPIVREPSGLACSSRNERLTESQKELAANIYAVLRQSVVEASSLPMETVQHNVTTRLNACEGLEVEYFSIVDATTLQATTTFHNAIGCVAVYCGAVRLIDNILYGENSH